MRKRSKKVAQDIRPWVRVKPVEPTFPADDPYEPNDRACDFSVPSKVKSRWVAGGKRDRQVKALTLRRVHMESRPLYRALTRTRQLNYNFVEKLTRTKHRLVPLRLNVGDFAMHSEAANFGDETQRFRTATSQPYDLLFNKADMACEDGLLEIKRLHHYKTEKRRAQLKLDQSLYRRHFAEGLRNERQARILTRNKWLRIRLLNTLSGRGRNKNSCFLLGRSRTFNRQLSLARHSTRKLTASSHINGLIRT